MSLFDLLTVVRFSSIEYKAFVINCRASMAGSAIPIVLPLALIVWLMRRSGMMGVSHSSVQFLDTTVSALQAALASCAYFLGQLSLSSLSHQ